MCSCYCFSSIKTPIVRVRKQQVFHRRHRGGKETRRATITRTEGIAIGTTNTLSTTTTIEVGIRVRFPCNGICSSVSQASFRTRVTTGRPGRRHRTRRMGGRPYRHSALFKPPAPSVHNMCIQHANSAPGTPPLGPAMTTFISSPPSSATSTY